MKWHLVRDEMISLTKSDMKGVEYLYIISQYEDKKPFKVGITNGDIQRRMSNMQTAFIDFDVYYLIALPDNQARALENAIHTDPTLKRIPFPRKSRNQKQIFSEWIQSPLSKIVKSLDKHALNSDTIKPMWGYNLTEKKAFVMQEYVRDHGDPEFGKTKSRRSGRTQTLSKKASNKYNSVKMDNNRTWDGIDFSMVKNERRPTQYTNM
jgi:hypothetical protein